jgi:hypothetical protein
MSSHLKIDFNGQDFCPPPAEQNAIVIWRELGVRYPKFWFGDLYLCSNSNPENYSFAFSDIRQEAPLTTKSVVAIGSISIGGDISVQLYEIPLIYPGLSDGPWGWSLSDPKSLDEFFKIMDNIYEGFHTYQEGQALQIGSPEGIDVLNKDQTVKKLYLQAADMLDATYERDFINKFKAELQNPNFEETLSDWRAHISAEVRENWHFLDELARLLFWMSAMKEE